MLFSPASSMTKPLARLQIAAWSPVPERYRGGPYLFAEAPGDYLNIRLAGTPAGRFAAIT